jgi:sec-independent protein translocase protein TatC
MPLVAHLRELRTRVLCSLGGVVVGMALAFFFREALFQWMRAPLLELELGRMQVLGLVEMFVVYLKLAALAGTFAAMPYVLWQVWQFVAPGLYAHERRWVAPFIGFGSLFFLLGGLFAFYAVLPLGFRYLVAMVPAGVDANYRVEEYITLVVTMMLAFGLVFELPLLMWILAAAGVFSAEAYASVRKYWVVVAVTVGGVLTPPDPLTQILMAVPLIGFFELGIVGARLLALHLHQRAGDPVPDGPRLARQAAATNVDIDVELFDLLRQLQWFTHHHLQDLTAEVVVDAALVDCDLAVADTEPHPRHGLLAAPGSIPLLCLRHESLLRLPAAWAVGRCEGAQRPRRP